MDMSLSKLRELVMDREAWRACCSPWGGKELDTTEWLNWTELYIIGFFLMVIYLFIDLFIFDCAVSLFMHPGFL